MNEIVKYSNELHELKFNSLTEAQQNVFFTLLQQFRSTDGYMLELDFNRVFELAQIAEGTNYRKEILDKLGRLQEFKFRFQVNDLGDLRQDMIFPSMEVDSRNKVLKIRVSEGFKDRYISSPLKGWTKYELAEFVGLSGTYVKTIYRYLKQFRQTGHWWIRYDDFKKLLGIPDSYRATDIDRQILKPSLKELSSERSLFNQRRTLFKGLVVKKIKNGKFIEALEFCFEPQPLSDIERDDTENRRNLAAPASDDSDKRQENPEPKPDDISVEELQIYLYRNLRLYDKKFDRYNVVKIQRILAIPNSEGVRLEWQNIDDGFKQHYDLSSASLALNFIKKYAM